MKTTRRGFLGTLLAIPLVGLKQLWPKKALVYHPLDLQGSADMLMSAHMKNVKELIAQDMSFRLERAFLDLEDLEGGQRVDLQNSSNLGWRGHWGTDKALC
jgi:hypothetical protein